VSTLPDDPDATYLPERYRQQVKTKKQRRIYKKLVIAAGVIVIIIVAYVLLSSMLLLPQPYNPLKSPVTTLPTTGEKNPAPEMNVTVTVTPGYILGTGISTLNSADVMTLNDAVSFLRLDFPEKTYELISANLTDRYAGHRLYEFTIHAADSPAGTGILVFEDAVSGDPFTPGQENARITAEQAKDLAGKTFPTLHPDQVRVRYSAIPNAGRIWDFSFVLGTSTILRGSIDTETGLISSYTRTLQKLGRPALPVLEMPDAQKIAERYISDQNGPVAVNTSGGTYSPLGSPSDPVAGQYLFPFSRIVNGIPCDDDGFVIGVDSVTGEVTVYERNWSAPDNAFSVAAEPFVLKREATFTVLQRAKETFPASVDGLRIVYAEIRWKDQHPYGVSPRPGSIPLAWKVGFEDDIIRANRSAQPALAWVDAQTGKILDFQYRH
jgi:hypothetical protein